MTISNGSTITASDIASLIATPLSNMQSDNARVPLGFQWHLNYPNLVAGTTQRNRTSYLVAPFDCYIEAVAVEAGDHTAASTTTLNITGTGPFENWPITITGTTGAGNTRLARLLYDNTKTKAGLSVATTSRGFRVWLKGDTLTFIISTTSVATPSMCHVAVVLRQFFSRGE